MEEGFRARASAAAEGSAREWIRKTLQETFRQAFRVRLTERLPSSSSSSGTEWVFSAEDLEDCVGVVEGVASKWGESLRKAEHLRAAAWVEGEYEAGRKNLWSGAPAPATTETSHPSGPGPVDAQPGNDGSLPPGENKPAGTARAREESSAESGATAPATESRASDGIRLPYSELRRLGHPEDPGAPRSRKDILHALRGMGRSPTRGEATANEEERPASCWPLDPELLEEAVKAIPTRQRSDPKSSSSSAAAAPPARYRVVPRSVWERNHGGDPGSAKEEQQKVLSEIWERKRKNAGRMTREEWIATRRRRGAAPERTAARITEVPRPPSDVSASAHRVRDELSDREKAKLDELLHDHWTNPDETPPSSMFGALREVGSTHARFEEEAKAQQGKPLLEDRTDKQRRRQERAYIKERLAPNRIQKNQDPQRYRSRVLRTEDDYHWCYHSETKKNASGNNNNNNNLLSDDPQWDPKRFFEFDMGWSFLDCRREDGSGREFLAFSSVEATLAEEEEAEAAPEQDTTSLSPKGPSNDTDASGPKEADLGAS